MNAIFWAFIALIMVVAGLPNHDSQLNMSKQHLSPTQKLPVSFQETYATLNNTVQILASNISSVLHQHSSSIRKSLDDLKCDLVNLTIGVEKLKGDLINSLSLQPVREWIDHANRTIINMTQTILSRENGVDSWTKIKEDFDLLTKDIVQPFHTFTENTQLFSILQNQDIHTLSHIHSIYLQFAKHFFELFFQFQYPTKRMTIFLYLMVEDNHNDDTNNNEKLENANLGFQPSMTLEQWHHILEVQANVEKAGYDFHLLYCVHQSHPRKSFSKVIQQDISMLHSTLSPSQVTILSNEDFQAHSQSDDCTKASPFTFLAAFLQHHLQRISGKSFAFKAQEVVVNRPTLIQSWIAQWWRLLSHNFKILWQQTRNRLLPFHSSRDDNDEQTSGAVIDHEEEREKKKQKESLGDYVWLLDVRKSMRWFASSASAPPVALELNTSFPSLKYPTTFLTTYLQYLLHETISHHSIHHQKFSSSFDVLTAYQTSADREAATDEVMTVSVSSQFIQHMIASVKQEGDYKETVHRICGKLQDVLQGKCVKEEGEGMRTFTAQMLPSSPQHKVIYLQITP